MGKHWVPLSVTHELDCIYRVTSFSKHNLPFSETPKLRRSSEAWQRIIDQLGPLAFQAIGTQIIQLLGRSHLPEHLQMASLAPQIAGENCHYQRHR